MVSPIFLGGVITTLVVVGIIALYKKLDKTGKERQEKEEKLLKTMNVDQIINYIDLWRGW